MIPVVGSSDTEEENPVNTHGSCACPPPRSLKRRSVPKPRERAANEARVPLLRVGTSARHGTRLLTRRL
ncbi:hypothetical protein EYF80_064620 [Liparis tanakae]|uniref:Uncharacterized protein n=1 Tax=Liparis tanakae TaxID=230148 RepID=A0A4Z2EAG7_9TELE|nr:hypothetical protein EYF80_064620 [Liparis tanakae]